MLFSLIIPVYNEELRLQEFFPVLMQFLEKHFSHELYEVILVNDGSNDRTEYILQKFQGEYMGRIKFFSYEVNKGKGYAIQQGVLNAQGELVFFTDIDLSVDMEVFLTMIAVLRADADYVIATRRTRESIIVVHQSRLRELLGTFYVYIARLLLGILVSDITCGLKGFRRTVARRLFKRLYCLRWSFDAEILFLAQKYDFSVAEVPVIWRNNANTKVRIVRDVVASFVDLIRIRCFNMFGKYES